MNHPSKNIDINTQEGLDLLKQKARYYGHYADNLKVLELISLIEKTNSQLEHIYKTIRPLIGIGDIIV